MSKFNMFKRAALGTALAGAIAATAVTTVPAAAQGPTAYRPTRDVLLSVGEGELISLPRNVANVWTSNAEVADVQVNTPRQIGLFGKTAGEATVIATAADGRVVYGARVRVSQNISSVSEMLRAAMPESDITVTNVGQLAVLNGTVGSPEDSAQAEQLVRTILNPGVDPSSNGPFPILPVNRLRIATPQQVMLKVTIAEVSRSLVRNVGMNFQLSSGDFLFARGRDFLNDAGQVVAASGNGTTAVANISDLFGLSGAVASDLQENNGLVTILAEPTLTSLSGETASFLAGGEFPIPISQSLGNVTVEYRQYGVGLAFTPFVLENGRISMRVRPEVSELSSAGAIEFNGFEVPSLTIRRTETTVELGSGQSLVIGGLMRNNANNSVERTPFLGSLPIIGALFRSNNFRRDETELVIVVTPYLVRPVSANQIALPTDGFRTANDAQRLLGDQSHDGRTGERRPMPVAAPPATVGPGIEQGASVQPAALAPAAEAQRLASVPAAQPGFDF
ncbi:type II and III secretion system protein family protein [Sphingosinicella sp. LHD-64]|uniref:type II and III secretion system protein family protein n=1 Tax=Sphingosinicella sp. LHD-64 TaxID=3072139 RepID=UPI00280C53E2|nr:type II and III secretion system protein family protein [Sphingosinicella sp. LHD-64]MDQ8755392.1 type II and III secretion system protein family protein [Sphingosinicella sp. LHD-64]